MNFFISWRGKAPSRSIQAVKSPNILRENFLIVGIVDQSTLFHKAVRLPDLTSSTTAKVFAQTWFKQFGFPQNIRVDAGGTYRKDFREYVGDMASTWRSSQLKPIGTSGS